MSKNSSLSDRTPQPSLFAFTETVSHLATCPRCAETGYKVTGTQTIVSHKTLTGARRRRGRFELTFRIQRTRSFNCIISGHCLIKVPMQTYEATDVFGSADSWSQLPEGVGGMIRALIDTAFRRALHKAERFDSGSVGHGVSKNLLRNINDGNWYASQAARVVRDRMDAQEYRMANAADRETRSFRGLRQRQNDIRLYGRIGRHVDRRCISPAVING